MTDISELELDLLLLCYLNSDDLGWVDTRTVSQVAQTKLGIIFPIKPMRLTQKHVDILTSRGILPDVKHTLNDIANNIVRKSRRKPKTK